ncbi:hypothetical protein [Psychrobacillus sp. L3]|uniref:hypothetical protein n=1 Tax=Psychrobacillus sp. L3 TaxID=3236891 RepID=UPI0036F2F53D
MSNIRKHGVYVVEELESNFIKGGQKPNKSWTPISYGMEIVFKQMQIAGNRPRTIQSYDYIFNQFVQYNGLVFIEEINSDSIYTYLDNIDVSIQTKKSV